jgi:hypothetical protein
MLEITVVPDRKSLPVRAAWIGHPPRVRGSRTISVAIHGDSVGANRVLNALAGLSLSLRLGDAAVELESGSPRSAFGSGDVRRGRRIQVPLVPAK